MQFWWTDFKHYLDDLRNADRFYIEGDGKDKNTIDWRLALSDFLHDPRGGKHQSAFEFSGELKCGLPAPDVVASVLGTYEVSCVDGSFPVESLEQIERIMQQANLTGITFSMSEVS